MGKGSKRIMHDNMDMLTSYLPLSIYIQNQGLSLPFYLPLMKVSQAFPPERQE